MEHLKIAIADDNQKILDLLDRVIGMEKDTNPKCGADVTRYGNKKL